MNTPRRRLSSTLALSVALLIASLAAPAHAAGPTSTLYIMNYGEFGGGTVTGLDRIQGLSEISTSTGLPLDIDIAVSGDVRTMGYSTTNQGARFDLVGNPLVGGPYTNNIANSQLHDGTSDGNYNYSANYTTGDVIQFDRNWASPVTLFNATANLPFAGWITMNTTDGSFWVSQWGGPDKVAHFTHTGTLLGSFNSGVLGSVGLALDPVDGTLWMGDGSFNLHQFSQAGSPLQTVPYSVQGSWYGMEFDTGRAASVPEPGGLALSGIAVVLGGLAHRRRRLTTAIGRTNKPLSLQGEAG
jgi:hypothetical protein